MGLQDIYPCIKKKLNVIISNEANFVTKPEHEFQCHCHWLPGKNFDQTLDKDRINPRHSRQKALEIVIPDESKGNAFAIVEFLLHMIQLWIEYLDDLWERNKYIASETVLKHPLITVLKYDGNNRFQGKYMLENKSEQDYERVYEFLRMIPKRRMYNIVPYRVS